MRHAKTLSLSPELNRLLWGAASGVAKVCLRDEDTLCEEANLEWHDFTQNPDLLVKGVRAESCSARAKLDSLIDKTSVMPLHDLVQARLAAGSCRQVAW